MRTTKTLLLTGTALAFVGALAAAPTAAAEITPTPGASIKDSLIYGMAGAGLSTSDSRAGDLFDSFRPYTEKPLLRCGMNPTYLARGGIDGTAALLCHDEASGIAVVAVAGNDWCWTEAGAAGLATGGKDYCFALPTKLTPLGQEEKTSRLRAERPSPERALGEYMRLMKDRARALLDYAEGVGR